MCNDFGIVLGIVFRNCSFFTDGSCRAGALRPAIRGSQSMSRFSRRSNNQMGMGVSVLELKRADHLDVQRPFQESVGNSNHINQLGH